MRPWPFGADRQYLFAATRERLANFVVALFEMLRGLGHPMPLDQDILTAKFVLRVAAFGRVAVRLHAVMKIEYLRGLAERGVDFLFRPNVERAFGGFGLL